jgi:hypothetical protein
LGAPFAAIIGVFQIGLPRRHAKLNDFFIDAGGLVLALAPAVSPLAIGLQNGPVSRVTKDAIKSHSPSGIAYFIISRFEPVRRQCESFFVEFFTLPI